MLPGGSIYFSGKALLNCLAKGPFTRACTECYKLVHAHHLAMKIQHSHRQNYTIHPPLSGVPARSASAQLWRIAVPGDTYRPAPELRSHTVCPGLQHPRRAVGDACLRAAGVGRLCLSISYGRGFLYYFDMRLLRIGFRGF